MGRPRCFGSAGVFLWKRRHCKENTDVSAFAATFRSCRRRALSLPIVALMLVVGLGVAPTRAEDHRALAGR
jgi:hypothetical protein